MSLLSSAKLPSIKIPNSIPKGDKWVMLIAVIVAVKCAIA